MPVPWYRLAELGINPAERGGAVVRQLERRVDWADILKLAGALIDPPPGLPKPPSYLRKHLAMCVVEGYRDGAGNLRITKESVGRFGDRLANARRAIAVLAADPAGREFLRRIQDYSADLADGLMEVVYPDTGGGWGMSREQEAASIAEHDALLKALAHCLERDIRAAIEAAGPAWISSLAGFHSRLRATALSIEQAVANILALAGRSGVNAVPEGVNAALAPPAFHLPSSPTRGPNL